MLTHHPAKPYDLAAPAGVRGAHAVIEQQVRIGPRRQGGQLLDQLDGFEQQMRRAIAPGFPQQHDGCSSLCQHQLA